MTREELLNIIETDHVQCGEAAALARMALAAMDSEPVFTLDAARKLKEGNYQLYRHAQPAPVVFDAIDTNLIDALRLVQCMLDDYRERNYGDAQGWIRHINTHMSDYTEAHGDDAYSVLHNLITASPQSPGSEPATVPEEITSAIEGLKQSLVDCNRYNYCFDAVTRVENACRAAMLQAGNSPVIQESCSAQFGNFQHYWHSKGYVMVPKEPTEAMCDIRHIGVDVYCGITDDNEYYSIGGADAAKVWKAMLAAAPQAPGIEPSTVPEVKP
jgi:hypothetical protein|nr:MAG TPA: hypothetical protein [Caudoviricetes sp.]